MTDDPIDRDPLDLVVRAFQQLPLPACPPAAPVLARIDPRPAEPAPRQAGRPRLAYALPTAAAVALLLVGGLITSRPNHPSAESARRPAPSGKARDVAARGLSPLSAGGVDVLASGHLKPLADLLEDPFEVKGGVADTPRMSLKERVTAAKVIVVATALAADPAPPAGPGSPPEHLVRFRVVRPLKSELATDTITTRTPPAAGGLVGKNWVVLLSPDGDTGRQLFVGCYDGKAEARVKAILDEVTGTVTMRGRPLAAGRVSFLHGNGQFVGSRVTAGKYAIDRAPAGVLSVTCEGDGVPAQYTREETTPLRADVKGGGTFDFDLK